MLCAMNLYTIYQNTIVNLPNGYNSLLMNPNDVSNKCKCEEFILNIITQFRKNKMSCSKYVEQLSQERLSHVVSCFLMGYYLYTEVYKKKGWLNSDFFEKMDMFYGKSSDEFDFLFLWALTCLYHDVGYVYEEGKRCALADFSILDEKDKPEDFPSIYNLANICLYEQLRRENCRKLDHGIYGALRLRRDFDELLKEGHPKTQTPNKAYNCAVWSIMCHNIWFKSPKDNCYKAKGLHSLVLDDAREKVKICESPFLYLLSLADNLEPYKKVKDIELWKSISFEIRDSSCLKVDFGDTLKHNKNTEEKIDEVKAYWKSIKGLNDWLVKVEPQDESLIISLTVYIAENKKTIK